MSGADHGSSNPGGAETPADAHGGAEHLVKMANDIGHFFRAEPQRDDAISGIANHIDKFWTKRMRQKLNAHLAQDGDAGLEELPRAALRRLASRKAAATKEPGGGDAG
jgi:formate dehydrogenase subunit delta